MIKRILFWLNNSRLFSLPMTVMSWLVIFLYSVKSGGNIINGLAALIGISFAHLATNLFDDYTSYVGEWHVDEAIEKRIRTRCFRY